MNIARSIIEKCGGAVVVSEIAGVHITRVYRWPMPREAGGCDGVIPARHHPRILKGARERGIDLKPEDFFDLSEAP